MKEATSNEMQVTNWARSGKTDSIIYELDSSLGRGSMTIQRLAPMCLVSLIDFACERCPNMPSNPLDTGQGRWFTVNYCFEGRCEASAGTQGFAVVKAGDCCVSCADSWPEEFCYPLAIYQGVELWINTELEHDPSFSLLGEASVSLEAIAKGAGLAAVFSKDDELNNPLRRIGSLLKSPETPNSRVRTGCKIELMRLLLALAERDVVAARPESLLSPFQMRTVKLMSQRMRASLADSHDVRSMASEVGVSAATLNNWFKGLYGMTAASYLRRLRIEKASELLVQGASVADAAIDVGYANPSKFAAAFKREQNILPSDFRRNMLSAD